MFLAVNVYKVTQKHRADAFYLHEEFLIASMPAEFLYRKVTQWHIYSRFLFTRIHVLERLKFNILP